MVSHPGTQDVGTEATRSYVFQIAEVLGGINREDKRRVVEGLYREIPDPTTSKLAEEVAQISQRLDAQSSRKEKLGTELEEALGEGTEVAEALGQVIQSLQQFVTEVPDNIAQRVKEVLSTSQASTVESNDDHDDEKDDSTEHPWTFRGARFYCAEEDCLFVMGDYAGTRRAWYHEYKADDHALETGHEIIEL